MTSPLTVLDAIRSGRLVLVQSPLTGDVTGLTGDVSGLRGDASGLRGDASGLRGDVDEARVAIAKAEGRMDNPNPNKET